MDSWADPQTMAQQATAWTVVMESHKGRLKWNARTWSRYLFGFHLVDACTTHSGALGRSSGRFIDPDGRELVLDDKFACFKQGFATELPPARTEYPY